MKNGATSACSGKVDTGFPIRTCANANEAERIPIHSIGIRSSIPSSRIAALLPLLLLIWSTRAHAHILSGDAAGGFISGFEHPISGLDHIVAMVSVGLWGAQLGAPAIWALPVTFPIVMAFGGMLGLLGVPLPGTEIGIAVSAIALGAVVAAEARPPLFVAALLVGFFAIFHGHSHGTEIPPDENGVLYSVGFVIATGLLHLTGIGIGLIHRWKAGQMVLRLGGAGVAAAGGWFLAGGESDILQFGKFLMGL